MRWPELILVGGVGARWTIFTAKLNLKLPPHLFDLADEVIE
jgi:hypothetical protein